jgi:hypothetical protein
VGADVNTFPTDELPQNPRSLDSTWPPSVRTAPPVAFWKGSGMSTLCPVGQSRTAPMSAVTPIATRRPITTLAATGPIGAAGSATCEWECATAHSLDTLTGGSRIGGLASPGNEMPHGLICSASPQFTTTAPPSAGERSRASELGRRVRESYQGKNWASTVEFERRRSAGGYGVNANG